MSANTSGVMSFRRVAGSAILVALAYHKVIQYSTAYFSSSEPIHVNGSKLWPGHLVGRSSAISSAALNPSAGWVLAQLKAATPLSKSGISVHHLAQLW